MPLFRCDKFRVSQFFDMRGWEGMGAFVSVRRTTNQPSEEVSNYRMGQPPRTQSWTLSSLIHSRFLHSDFCRSVSCAWAVRRLRNAKNLQEMSFDVGYEFDAFGNHARR
jgi:hypothetical protein